MTGTATETTEPPVLTPEEVAARERVDLTSVHDWLRRGVLRGYKLGRLWRIPAQALEEFRRHNAPPATTATAAARRTRPGAGRSRQAAADRRLDRAGVGKKA